MFKVKYHYQYFLAKLNHCDRVFCFVLFLILLYVASIYSNLILKLVLFAQDCYKALDNQDETLSTKRK